MFSVYLKLRFIFVYVFICERNIFGKRCVPFYIFKSNYSPPFWGGVGGEAFYIPLALKIFSLASLISLNLRSAALLTSSPRVATRSG